MKTELGRAIILVNDYEEALRFYEENFFCKVIHDSTTPEGQRFLHVGFADLSKAAGIWFLKADSPNQLNTVGHQTAGQPTLVIYTDDLERHYKLLLKNGVTIIEQPVITPESKFLHCHDLYGNRITLVEVIIFSR